MTSPRWLLLPARLAADAESAGALGSGAAVADPPALAVSASTAAMIVPEARAIRNRRRCRGIPMVQGSVRSLRTFRWVACPAPLAALTGYSRHIVTQVTCSHESNDGAGSSLRLAP